MKKIIYLILFIISAISVSAQNKIIFPGLSEIQLQKIVNTKIPVPLPTWIPDGFSVTNIITQTGRHVKLENKIFTITYSKKSSDGKLLEFKIEAGFEGIGDLPYEGGELIKSKAGNIYLFYEPFEEDMNGKKIKTSGLIMTEWFSVHNLAFDVVFSSPGQNETINKTKPKISKTDAKKILQSMQVLK